MTTRNFIKMFHSKLELVKADLSVSQYEILSDTANMTAEEVAGLIKKIRTEEEQIELDWLYSLTQPKRLTLTKLV